ncbi:MAG: tripartite tricarboxylate transporter substrate binding protein [Variovorax sp.]|nr:MAG: tripartite tricarboxylate transporter substrate binding protein [Variovorax sp.]
MKLVIRIALLAAATLGIGASALAQEVRIPKIIKIVVPFSPGGSNDLFARALGQKLSVSLNTPVVVDNRPGAGGAIGAIAVAQAEPDGGTLLLTSVSFVTNAAIQEKPAYDPVKSFAPVALLNRGPMLLIAGKETPYTTSEQVVQAMRTNKNMNYGSAGVGSIGQMATELLNSMARANATHVPYKGISNAVTDMMGGNLQMMITTAASVTGPLKAGQVRPIAVTSQKRSRFMPELPAIAEVVPGFEVESWWGVYAPPKTPRPLVERLNAEIRRIADGAEMRELFERESTEPGTLDVPQFATYVATETAKWRKLAAERGIKSE